MEILSPASNMEHIEVAIDAKSNAVYGGLKKWNARNKAINFTTEEYNSLIEKLHSNNIKFFLTLNILMLDKEIEEVISFLKENTLPDAFIVTDIGLIRELNKEFPDVPLHFSTQFGAHNIDDVDYIESLNGKRAILARELTMSEIDNIKQKSNIELECFVWGSQCLSFSGLCFFGTLINGGGGNRGKCIITCRDIYSINNEKGHYLYVPDMDCLNLISKLDGIDCLKLEGRRRPAEEIKQILNQISNKMKSKRTTGYLLGTNIQDNNLYEKINTRTKPFMNASDLEDINDNDVCAKYIDNVPIEFSKDYNDEKVMYLYTEIKKSYDINKKNVSLDLTVDKNNITKVLYMNYKGDGHTFFGDENNLIKVDLNELINKIETMDSNINVYKIKYQRNNSKSLTINKEVYDEVIDYIITDCIQKKINVGNGKDKLKYIYLDTSNINVIRNYIDDGFVRLIYNIETVNDLKNIKDIIDEFGDKIIYKLPLFNWKSYNLLPYLNLLENKEVMFTRFTQIYLCKNINFRKKYADYTIYIWNKKALNYLIENNFTEFTASPELSYETNINIFGKSKMQVILCGKLPLVYTRNCFSHLFGCVNCKNSQCIKKPIKNEDKNLNFDVLCNSDYRYILNKEPMLNDYSKINTDDNVDFRYSTYGQSIEEIYDTITYLKKGNYYDELKKLDFWKDSYECNLFEGKE